MLYRVEGDYFWRWVETDNWQAIVERSRQAYKTKSHPLDKNDFSWISKRIKRVFDMDGTQIYPPKPSGLVFKYPRINKRKVVGKNDRRISQRASQTGF